MTQELLTVSDVKFKFVNVTENMEADIKKAVEHQLANKGQTITAERPMPKVGSASNPYMTNVMLSITRK